MIIIESEFFYYNLFIQTLLKLLEIKELCHCWPNYTLVL